MAALFVILPGVAIAGWLAFLFARKRHYEKGVIVFLSITLAPLLAWYLTLWLRDDSPLWRMFEALPGGLWDLMPGLAMVGVFVWLCIYWARKGQQLEERAPSGPSPSSDAHSPPPASAIEGTVRERLATLEQLRRDGLISDSEYQAKRADILASI